MGPEQGPETGRVDDVGEAEAMARAESSDHSWAAELREEARSAPEVSDDETKTKAGIEKTAEAWDRVADDKGAEARAAYRAEKEGKFYPVHGERKGSMLNVGGEWFRILGKAVGTPHNEGWQLENGKGEKVHVALDDPRIEAEVDDYGFPREINKKGL